ncbi:Ger(x)C family spore germination protein [Paenibacillus sp.]|jgi:spore germination protein KC|uniref:Ger(x)C family spore germination protein n=1 Tax=Paenibacillus sp. TaxID=58172 RepID=UPI0028251976|nr:Ger(x)C family spore germination protein [Paenibacillus sp.]MDR0267099.1 Ger(x)C family spore germination protein [Paenibacillus sp.]
MKRFFSAGLLLCSSLGLSGCWDRTEINDVAFVVGSGVDKEKGMYRSTVQIALPGNLGGAGSEGGGGGTGDSKTYYLESKTGTTLRDSRQEVQAGNSRKISFAHRRTLLLGEELAKSGIESVFDQFGRVPENRLSSSVAVTEGPAYKILDADAPMELFPSEMIHEQMNLSTKRPVTLKYLAIRLLSDGIDIALPYISLRETVPEDLEDKEKKNIQITGLALFKEDKLVGVLKGQGAQAINLAMNQATAPELLVPSPSGKSLISIRFTENLVTLKPVIRGNNITMHMNILAKGTVIENNSNDSLVGEGSIRQLEQHATKEIVKQIQSAMRLLQNRYHSDVLGFGQTIHQKKPAAWEHFKDRWEEIYPTVKVVIHAKLHVANIGEVNKPFGKKDKELKHE